MKVERIVKYDNGRFSPLNTATIVQHMNVRSFPVFNS